MIELVIGGARSGKSSYAQQLATKWSCTLHHEVEYIATATAIDTEMAQRIALHQAHRPTHWQLAEVPLQLAEHIQSKAQRPPQVLLIDCLTLWLNNLLYHNPNACFSTLFNALINAATASPHHCIFVANEVGLGVIPMGSTSRQFVDQAGWLNQAMANAANNVTFIAAGLPLKLKGD